MKKIVIDESLNGKKCSVCSRTLRTGEDVVECEYCHQICGVADKMKTINCFRANVASGHLELKEVSQGQTLVLPLTFPQVV